MLKNNNINRTKGDLECNDSTTTTGQQSPLPPLPTYPCVLFLVDVSDQVRAYLFQSALCVVYTPPEEHFGTVPLEAMAAGTPVVAVASGGPLETIVNGKTVSHPRPRKSG